MEELNSVEKKNTNLSSRLLRHHAASIFFAKILKPTGSGNSRAQLGCSLNGFEGDKRVLNSGMGIRFLIVFLGVYVLH